MSLDWLKNERRPDSPFLLFVHHKTPHAICEAKQEHLDLFKDTIFPEPATIHDDHAGRTAASASSSQRLDTWPYYTEQAPSGLSKRELRSFVYQRYMRDYCASIASMDDNIGRLLEYLEQTGELDNTVVVYSSDQGMFLGDHGWYNKMFMYEEPIRMPLMIRYPKLASPGSVDSHMVLNVDFAETLLDLAGVNIPKDMQGKSLKPLLKGEKPSQWRHSFFYQHYGEWVEPHYGVRTDRYKLIRFYSPDQNVWELYDLKNDPEELKNVYDKPGV